MFKLTVNVLYMIWEDKLSFESSSFAYRLFYKSFFGITTHRAGGRIVTNPAQSIMFKSAAPSCITCSVRFESFSTVTCFLLAYSRITRWRFSSLAYSSTWVRCLWSTSYCYGFKIKFTFACIILLMNIVVNEMWSMGIGMEWWDVFGALNSSKFNMCVNFTVIKVYNLLGWLSQWQFLPITISFNINMIVHLTLSLWLQYHTMYWVSSFFDWYHLTVVRV